MVEAASSGNQGLEYEVRGGLWEGVHAALFYVAVVCTILATLGAARLIMGSVCVFLIFYSIFGIFSSPTYVIIDPVTHRVTVERYHYFIASRRQFEPTDLENIEVVEPYRTPSKEGEKDSKRDLSYYVRVYLDFKAGGRLKIFRSGMTGAPDENREKAFLVALSAASALDIPVVYTAQGRRPEAEEVKA